MSKKFLNSLNQIISKNYILNGFSFYECFNSINIVKKNSNNEKNLITLWSSKFFILKCLLLLIQNLFKFLISIFLLIFFSFFKKKKYKDCKILFVTHTFGNADIEDNYFGNFKNILKKKSIKFTSYNIKHNKVNLKKFENDLHFFDILKITLSIFSKFIFWFFVPFYKKIDLKIYIFLLSNLISTSTLNNYKIIYEILRIIKNSKKISKIFFTFEGHIYENFLIQEVKKKFKDRIKLIGYQHTGLSKDNNSIFLQDFKKYKPDKILCINYNDVKLLKKKYKLKKIFNIGKYIKKVSLKEWKVSKKVFYKKNIKYLILLDDNAKEIKDFLKNSDIKNKFFFTIRCHPEKINQLKSFNTFKNIKISKFKNYLNDFNLNDILIYSKSSLSLEGIKHGLLPIKIKNLKDKETIMNSLSAKNIKNIFSILDNLNKYKYKNYYNYSLSYASNFNKKLFEKIANE